MKKKASKAQSIKATKSPQSQESLVNADFDAVVNLIDAAKSNALISVNTILIELYWEIGHYISQKINNDGWGQGTVQHLAEHIVKNRGTSKGFSAQNLWRMRQIYDAYSSWRKLAPLVREISWSDNLLILSRCKTERAKAFYLETTIREKWGNVLVADACSVFRKGGEL
jgi:predicted nuclease of restriction endonuclease-like (RecB) superfamily